MKSITFTTIITTLFFCVTSFSSCTKNVNGEIFFWNQTQCAEPWETILSDSKSKIKLAITKFLADEEIEVSQITFEFDKSRESQLTVCTGTTGTKIIITVEEGNSIKMEELGFEKI